MKSHTIAPVASQPDRTAPVWTKRVLPLMLTILASTLSLHAQGTATGGDADKQTIQMLLQRIERLEARVEQLEGTQAKVQAASLTGQPTSRQLTVPAAGPAEEPKPS
ncbi:MAG TPA: hypothetical protein VLL05_06110, partial [Terriglobales bacterium]|nr:hypothetical protein [Terriglobales bacterium]